MRSPSWLVPVIVSLFLLLIPHNARAQNLNATVEQDSLTQGFHQDRNYFSPEPWEHFDPVTGNVILTFTDMALPGNAGRELRFQRTFNNLRSIGGPDTVSRWTFGFAGMVMRVIEQTIVPGTDYMDELTPVFGSTPRLVMADGSERSTVFVQRPSTSPSQTQTWRWVRSGEFFEYDIETNQLWMPDGTVSQYDSEGLLTGFTDPFGNAVTLDRSIPGSLVVTQYLGNSPPRVVTFTLDEDDRPTQMEYLGRSWQYTYGSPHEGVRDIETVALPVGSAWTFTYGPGDLTTVTTPNQGAVTYCYEDRTIYDPQHPGDPSYAEEVHVLKERRISGTCGAPGAWVLLYGAAQVGDTYSKSTQITMPSGASVVFQHGPIAQQPGRVMAGGVGLHTRTVYESTGVVLEVETRTYEIIKTVFWDDDPEIWWGTTKLKERTITRPSSGSSQSYTTTFTYPSAFPGHYHQPSQIVESGELTRTTTFDYDHLNTGTLFAVGLLKHQTIQVGSETLENAWTHSPLTGFRTSESRFGITTTFTPDAYGNIARATKENNKFSDYQYSYGQVSVSSAPGVVVTRQINPDGSIAAETIAGRTTTYSYDDLGRVTLTAPPSSNAIVTEYDPGGSWVRVSRGTSQLTTTLDGFGRPIGTVNSVGVKTRIGYDAEGRKTYHSLPYLNNEDVGLAIAYDGLNRVVSETHSGGASRTRAYGASSITVTDEESRETWIGRAAFGHPDDARIVHVIDPAMQGWLYTYNAIGSLRQVIAPDNTIREWQYDPQTNLLTSETHPESGTTLYQQYDAAGVLKQKKDANNTVFLYTHDDNDRLATITAGNEVTTVSYEPGSDNRKTVIVGGLSTEFSYDATGRPSGRTDTVDGYQFTTTYEYDANDNVTSIFYPSFGSSGSRRRIGYDYDNEHRISRVFDLQATRDFATNFSYHPSGAVTSYTAGNNVTSTFAYDPNRYWMTSLSIGGLWSLQYQNYDSVGSVGDIIDSRPGANQTFTYDLLDRLSTASGPYGSIGYSYNVHGNRTDANGSTYTYYPGTLRLQTQNAETYTYDSNGNLLSAPNKSFTYTPRNLAATASTIAGSASYAYDADDWRVKKTSGTDTTYYLRGLNGELLAEWKNPGPSGETQDYIYAGSRLVSIISKPWNESSDFFGTIVANGPPVTVPFTVPGQKAWLTFHGTQGQRVSVRITTTSQTLCLAWPMAIRKPDATTLVSLSACGSAFIEPVALPVSGTYTLLIDPNGTLTGTATVTLYDVVDITSTIAIDGPAVPVPLATPGQKAQLTFDGTSGQRVSVRATTTSQTICLAWPLAIRKPDATTLVSLSACGSAFIEPVVLPVSGTYTILIDPNSSHTGTATVKVYEVIDVTGAIAIDGPAVSVPVTTPGQQAWLTFSGTAGQRTSSRLTRTSGTSCLFASPMTIRKPDGTTLASLDSCASSFMEPVVLPVSGTYTILIDPPSTHTGTATVNLYDVAPDPTGVVTVNAPATPVVLADPGQNGSLTFATTTAGQQATVRMTGNTVGQTTTVRLLRPDGSQQATVASSSTNFNMTIQTLTAAGEYRVVVDPSSGNTGTVNVAVTNP